MFRFSFTANQMQNIRIKLKFDPCDAFQDLGSGVGFSKMRMF